MTTKLISVNERLPASEDTDFMGFIFAYGNKCVWLERWMNVSHKNPHITHWCETGLRHPGIPNGFDDE